MPTDEQTIEKLAGRLEKGLTMLLCVERGEPLPDGYDPSDYANWLHHFEGLLGEHNRLCLATLMQPAEQMSLEAAS